MLADKVLELIQSEAMVNPGDCVVCGLSGGADSVCLLLAMLSLSEKLGISVESLHVNHCLRGSESDRDEAFCRELCARLGVPFKAVSCDVRTFEAENQLYTEEAARKLRYGIFAEHSAGKKLATAHNADDNLETVILNLARGSALKGLAGIPAKRGNIIRPLLSVSRREIEEFLAAQGQSFVTDSTNLSDDYTRNKIRHRIVPLLREINPSVTATSVRSISALREENSHIEAEADAAENACRNGEQFTGLADYPAVVRKRCIARLLSGSGIPYSAERLNELGCITVNGGKSNLSGDIYYVSDGRIAGLQQIAKPAETQELSAELVIGENRIFPGRTLCCEIVQCDEMKKFEAVHSLLTYAVLDYDKIKGRAFVRSRRNGDRIRLSGRSFTSSVKKLLNAKIPASQRRTLHFIGDAEGTVYAENIGIADRVKPDSSSRSLLIVYVRDNF